MKTSFNTFDNLQATLNFQKVKVRVSGEKALYVNIDNWTVYIDNSTNEQIIDFWFSDKLRDQEISVNDLIEENKRLKAEIAELKAKEETSIFWASSDIQFIMDHYERYNGVTLSEEEQREIIKSAIAEHNPDFGLNWNTVRSYLERFLQKKNLERFLESRK
jgi:hypothetical protein